MIIDRPNNRTDRISIKPKEQPILGTFLDSNDKPHVINIDPNSTDKKLQYLRTRNKLLSFKVPEANQTSPILIYPQINIDPTFNTDGEFIDLLEKKGLLINRPIEVENLLGKFISKHRILTVAIHGYPHHGKHMTGKHPSQDYFISLRDKLLSLGIRPPQLFLSCDEQLTSENANQAITFHRFDQKGELGVLGFPYLLNIVNVMPDGTIRVLEAEMKQQVGLKHLERTSVSPFANPLEADLRLVLLVQKLFACPSLFNQLVKRRLRSTESYNPAEK
jgi:hypothetical protein